MDIKIRGFINADYFVYRIEHKLELIEYKSAPILSVFLILSEIGLLVTGIISLQCHCKQNSIQQPKAICRDVCIFSIL